MDVIEAITNRKSIRAFKPDPIPAGILKDIMRLAQRSPSWANTQPWEFAVVSGRKLVEIKQAFAARTGEKPNPDFDSPGTMPEPYSARTAGLFTNMARVTRMAEGDQSSPIWWFQEGQRLYGAPAAIYIFLERSYCLGENSVNVWPVFDCGLIAENIMLLATGYGLGTIAQAQAVHYPDVLREMLDIPKTKAILLGIAIGYPDWDRAVNQFTTDRENMDTVVRWHDID